MQGGFQGGLSSRARRLAFVSVVLSIAGLHVASAITFDVKYGERRCLSEDVPSAADVRGEVHVSGGGGDMSLDLFVSDPRGVVYFHRADANAVKYSFRAGTFDSRIMQAYRFCVVHQVHPNAVPQEHVTRRVSLTVNVESAATRADVEALAKKGHLTAVQESFHEVYAEVDSLLSRMDDLRVKEETLSSVNDDTSRAIVRITLVAAFFTIATGVLNFLNLKSFFKSKKLA